MILIENITYKESSIAVLISTGETLALPAESLKMYALSRGKVIDPVEYRELKEEADRFSCRRKALYYLSIRNRSSREMENYLIKKGFSKDHIREVIMKLRDSGFIDDYNYAVRYISYKKSVKAVGRQLLKSELYRKGISRELINKALSETGEPEADRESAYHLALKKLHQLEHGKKPMEKLILFLRRRGFDESDIRTVIGRIKSEGLFDNKRDQQDM